jgi:PTS system galactitol-specific IIA component
MSPFNIIVVDKHNYSNWEECYTYMAGKLAEKGKVKAGYCESVLSRERMFPTGLIMNENTSIALPHASDPTLVIKSTLVVAFPDPPLEVHLMEDSEKTTEASVIIMLCLRQGDNHLEMLQNLINIFQDRNFFETFIQSKDTELLKAMLLSGPN